MIKVCKTMTTQTAHRLIGYEGKCAHIHGHSYKWEVAIWKEGLDERGIAVDFGEIKDVMKRMIDEEFDHALVLHVKDPLVLIAKELNLPVEMLLFAPTNLGYMDQEVLGAMHDEHSYFSGKDGNLVLLPRNPTAEVMAGEMAYRISGHFDAPVQVRCWETDTCYAEAKDDPTLEGTAERFVSTT